MKKIFLLLLSVVLCLSFCGCVFLEDDKPTKEATASVSSSKAAPKNEIFGLNETAVFDSLKVTANEIKKSNGKQFLEPEQGKVFVGVKFTVENTSDEDQVVSSILLFDAYVDSVKCNYSISAMSAFDGTLDGTITPGKKLIGYYAVEVPTNWKELELQVKSSWLSNSKASFVFSNK